MITWFDLTIISILSFHASNITQAAIDNKIKLNLVISIIIMYTVTELIT